MVFYFLPQMTQIDTEHIVYYYKYMEKDFITATYYLLLITYYLLHPSFPSPDRNGYPAAGAGGREGLSVGERWREEYEWIAGLSSEIKWECGESKGV